MDTIAGYTLAINIREDEKSRNGYGKCPKLMREHQEERLIIMYDEMNNNRNDDWNNSRNDELNHNTDSMDNDLNNRSESSKEEQNPYYQTYQAEVKREEVEKKPKKDKKEKKAGGGFFKKALVSVSLGVLFGVFAGAGFFAVQKITGAGKNENRLAISDSVDSVAGNVSKAQESQSGSSIKLTDTQDVRVVTSDVSDVVEEVMPAMVSIVNNYTETATTFFGQSYSQEKAASGSGIIVGESDSELLIATNHHVVADASKLEVTFTDSSTAEAQIKGMDSDMDLAVIAVPLDSLSEETKAAISVATLGDSDALKLGEPVIAIGNALGYGQSVSGGYVSALNREITMEDGSKGTFIQTDAAINPGNSGGALLNVKGEVIGINSSKIGGSTVEGMGFAIPISAAEPIISELMLKETRTLVADDEVGYMGISMQTITSQFSQMYRIPEGIYIVEVTDGSAAKEAGLLPGDVLVEFDGEKVSTAEELQSVIKYYKAGSTATLTVKRAENGEYKTIELQITLGKRPKQ